MVQSAAHSGATMMGVNAFILMDRQRFMRESREQEHCTTQTAGPKMEGLFLVVFQHRRVSSTNMKHAVTVSYLKMSQGGKVRQQPTDVLQPAWPLKHISMLMDVRWRLNKKKRPSLTLDFWAHSQVQLSKLILRALQMEQVNKDSKQVKVIEERTGVHPGECTRSVISRVHLPVWSISRSRGSAAWKDGRWFL